jgi:mono/diheme cytochrome c family protein
MKKVIFWVAVALLAVTIIVQLVPHGRNHTNPAVIQEPNWDSPQTRQLAQRACFDCHSNETVWPWYSNIAPASWLVQKDVDEARRYLNFSEWTGSIREADEIAEVVAEGEMPPSQYLLMHPQARLNASEKDALIRGLNASVR